MRMIEAYSQLTQQSNFVDDESDGGWGGGLHWLSNRPGLSVNCGTVILGSKLICRGNKWHHLVVQYLTFLEKNSLKCLNLSPWESSAAVLCLFVAHASLINKTTTKNVKKGGIRMKHHYRLQRLSELIKFYLSLCFQVFIVLPGVQFPARNLSINQNW